MKLKMKVMMHHQQINFSISNLGNRMGLGYNHSSNRQIPTTDAD
jgi:hypothetical protein